MNTQISHIPVETRLFRDGVLIGTSHALYLGLLGMVVEAPAGELQIGQGLEVELRLAGNDPPPPCRVRAVVSGHSRLGVGLTFPDPGKQGCTQLQDMIFQSWRSAAAPRHMHEGRRPTAIAWQTGHALPKAG